MKTGDLGKEYQDRTVIFRQGEAGDWMYVIQEGKVEVYLERDGNEIPFGYAGRAISWGDGTVSR